MATKRFKILGLKWRDTYGNTYHTVQIIDNSLGRRFKSKITYGYENQYIQTAQSLLKSKGYRVKISSLNSNFESYYVKRKKDL